MSLIVHLKASNQRWWLSLVAAISVCLWAVNWLPIQSVEYRLTTNIAISQHRLPILKGLAGKKIVSSDPQAPSFVVQEVQGSAIEAGSAALSDLSSARVTVLFKERGMAGQIETLLDQWTVPNLQSEECRQLESQIHKERWFLETALHSKKRFELDAQREKEARNIATGELIDVAESRSTTKSPSMRFQLSSFVTHRSSSLGAEDFAQKIETTISQRSNQVQALEVCIQRLQAQTQGFLNFTGAPTVAPIVQSIPRIRLMVLGMICLSIWCLLAWWARPTLVPSKPLFWKTGAVALQRLKQWFRKISLPKQSFNDSTKSPDLRRRFEVVGIPYLGSVQIQGPEDSRSFTPLPVLARTKRSLQATASVDTMSNTMSKAATEESIASASYELDNANVLQLLRRLGEGSLVVWVVVLIARLGLDPAWRELVSVAPLAALARLILGIQ